MLADQLKVCLGTVFAFYVKAQNFHWNVESDDFSMHHSFFGDLYEEVHDSIDPLAETIRTLNEYAPGSFKRFAELSVIQDQTGILSADQMMVELYNDNNVVLETLRKAYKTAESSMAFGPANFLQDRIQAHDKHAWMLRSFIKKAKE